MRHPQRAHSFTSMDARGSPLCEDLNGQTVLKQCFSLLGISPSAVHKIIKRFRESCKNLYMEVADKTTNECLWTLTPEEALDWERMILHGLRKTTLWKTTVIKHSSSLNPQMQIIMWSKCNLIWLTQGQNVSFGLKGPPLTMFSTLWSGI